MSRNISIFRKSGDTLASEDEDEDENTTTPSALSIVSGSGSKKRKKETEYVIRATADEFQLADLEINENDLEKLKRLPCNKGVLNANRCATVYVKIGNDDPFNISLIMDSMRYGLGHLLSANIALAAPLTAVNSCYYLIFSILTISLFLDQGLLIRAFPYI